MGAPVGNSNAVKHGLQAKNLLTTGALPKGAGYVKRITNELRAAIENAVSDAKGEVCLHDSAVAQTAIRWERHALLAQKWLRLETDNLTPDQRLAFSRDIARASTERDKCLRELGLNIKPNADPWSVLDIRPALINGNDESPVSTRRDDTAPDGQSDDQTPACATSDSVQPDEVEP